MRKALGFTIVLCLFVLAPASAAQLNLGADPLWRSLMRAESRQGTVVYDSTTIEPDCSIYDHGFCYYSWDSETQCCVAPDYGEPPLACPWACF
ncbi:MAG TPA: hypothetical protein VF173_05805 [Thermoanaerobaculia bacterium]|nr:hypothetical protein [Thermoanaerobaculia bacterium]